MNDLNMSEYRKNADGHLVKNSDISDYDKLRDQLVMDIVGNAKVVQSLLTKFRKDSMDEIQALIELAAEKYDIKIGGKKGNACLYSFDGRYKVLRSINEYLVFDEKLTVAKELIDEFINDKLEGVDSDIAELIRGAFKVDKDGRVSTTRILGLRSFNITNKKWRKAMEIIADSIHVSNSKSYIRVYERVGNSDEYKQIPLNVSGV